MALRGKRYIPPEAEEQRKKTERLLLEELKHKSTSVHEAPRGGDPLEEFRREEQRLKETQSPLLMDNPLRMANKNLQKERARQFLINQPLQTIEPFRTFPSPQRDQTATRSPLPFNSMPLSITTAKKRQPFYQQTQQSNRNVESPVSLLPQVRRGATPTGQIVRGKPPTPPPSLSRDDRARSKSPYALKLLRGVSNSAPPAMAKKGQQQNHVEAAEERRESNPMVNPQLYALRQSLYAKERERIGGGGRTTDGVAFAEPDEERARQNGAGRAEESLFISSGHSPYSFSVSSPTTFTHNHHIPTPPSSAPSFAFEQRTHPPVKPILKRSGTNGGKQNETAQRAEENWQRQKQQMNANYEENGEKTQNERQRKDKRDGGQMGDGQMGYGQIGYGQMGDRRESRERAADPWGNAGGRPGRVKTLDEESRPAAFSRATTNQTADIGERSDTPQFPVTERTETPLPYHPLLYRRDNTTEEMVTQRQQWAPNGQKIDEPTTTSSNRNNSNTTMNRIGAITPHGMDGTSAAAGGSNRRASLSQSAFDSSDVIHHHPVFVKDTSRYWYKPTISREEAIAMLKDKPPGTFIVRDSNSFPGAFGLALKVAQPPAGVPSSADGNELVRHFLIEPSPKGVRLKGCSNEPVFGTLAALVYQHSITPLALPCRLILPEFDPAATPEHLNSNQALLERGAACNVTYLCSVDTESLTGPEALRRSTAHCFELLQRRELRAVSVHFKVSSQGITLTDNTRSMFFRRHYPANKVTFAGIDPESRVFDNNNVSQLPPTYVRQAPIFGFVARKCVVSDHSGSVDNACHLFAELDPDQPASAVVRFITNVMMPIGRAQLHQIHQNVNSQ